MGMFKRMKDLKEVSAEDWSHAVTGRNDRIKANRAVAQRFNALYTGRA